MCVCAVIERGCASLIPRNSLVNVTVCSSRAGITKQKLLYSYPDQNPKNNWISFVINMFLKSIPLWDQFLCKVLFHPQEWTQLQLLQRQKHWCWHYKWQILNNMIISINHYTCWFNSYRIWLLSSDYWSNAVFARSSTSLLKNF